MPSPNLSDLCATCRCWPCICANSKTIHGRRYPLKDGVVMLNLAEQGIWTEGTCKVCERPAAVLGDRCKDHRWTGVDKFALSPLVGLFALVAVLSICGGPATSPFSVVFGGLAWAVGQYVNSDDKA